MLRGLAALLAAKVVCCGLLLLLATGALGGVLAFSSENYLVLVVVGVAVAAVSLIVWHVRGGRESKACSAFASRPRQP